jgi:hypothetical protein
MIKFFICTLVLLSASLRGQEMPLSETSVDPEEKDFKVRESHWVTTFGAEQLNYELPYEFAGVKKNFSPGKRSLTGGRFGIGRELYLGGGFFIAPKVEAFYVGTLFENIKSAGPEEEDIDISGIKNSGSLYGAEAGGSLSWMFDFKTKNPFMDEMVSMALEFVVEAGVGKAKAYNKRYYYYDLTGTAVENYTSIVEDELSYNRLGAGVNILSGTSGFFLYLRSSVTNFDVTKREIRTTQLDNGAGSPVRTKTNLSSVDMDPVQVYMLGGGYKF